MKLPRDCELVSQIHTIKCYALPSGKVSFDTERNAKSHADKLWAAALACQKKRNAARPSTGEIRVRVVG